MILKPGKLAREEPKSYRHISLLPVILKLFEKLLLKIIKVITTGQVHRITDRLKKEYVEKEVCSALFLDITQVFDKADIKDL